MNLVEIFSIIIIHWIADFVLQTDKQAKGESKNWNDLLKHTITYSFCWLIPMGILLGKNPPNGGIFILITFICHTITDYFTSRLNSKLYQKIEFWKQPYLEYVNKEYRQQKIGFYTHNFFVSIGFDQVLHYIQLFTTYYYLKT